MRRSSLAISASIIALCAGFATPALAQDTTTADPPDSPVEPTPTPTDEEREPSSTVLSAENPATQDAIIVTGSRIRRPDFDTPNPVVSIGGDQIEKSGTTNLTDFLTGFPALQGSFTSAFNSGNDSAIGWSGLNLLNLRNLGYERTLVLVDGRRHIAALPGSQSVDIGSIPSDLVERVDILTGGASAIYGADGVSGVVNFVLKRNFDGISGRVQHGISGHGDAGQRLYAVTIGKNFADDRGNIVFAYERGREDRLPYYKRNRLYGENRVGFFLNPDDPENLPGYDGPVDNGIPDNIPLGNVRFNDTWRGGGLDFDADGIPDFNVMPGGVLVPFEVGEVLPTGFESFGGNGTLESDYSGDLLPDVRRNVFNFLGHFDVSPALTLFAEAKYAKTKAFTISQPTWDYYLQIKDDNPFITPAIADQIIPGIGEAVFGPGAQDFLLVNRDDFDFGTRGENIDRKTFRSVVGARGEIGGHADYELSYVHGRTKVRNKYVNDIFADRLYAAVDVVTDPATGQPTCRVNLDPNWVPDQPFVYVRPVIEPTTFQPGQCAPLNLFGEGAPSQAALDFIRADTMDRSRITQDVVSGSISGDLEPWFTFPGGQSLGYAFGAEYRKEASKFTPDDVLVQGLTFGNELAPESGKFNIKEVFGEVRLPVFTGQPLAHKLEVGGAVRFSDYSTIGHTTAWKVDGAYAPVRDITFTGTYSRAVRAPNVGELFAGLSQTFEFITDPCNTNEIQNGTQFRAANCAALLTSLGVADPDSYFDDRSSNTPGLLGGNRDLQEETAKTLTFGAILQPRFIPGLTARIDYYDIKLLNAISTATSTQLAELCVDQPTLDNVYCSLITRENGGPNAGFIIDYELRPFNVAQFRTSGIDLNLNYRLRTERMGTFSLNLIGNYLKRLEFIATPGAEVDDDRGEAFAPKYTANADLSWNRGPLTLNYGLLWFSKTIRSGFGNRDLENNPDVLPDRYKKMKAHWQHDIFASVQATDKFEMYGGINNLFNQKPEIGTDKYPVDSIGRFFFVGAKVKIDRLF